MDVKPRGSFVDAGATTSHNHLKLWTIKIIWCWGLNLLIFRLWKMLPNRESNDIFCQTLWQKNSGLNALKLLVLYSWKYFKNVCSLLTEWFSKDELINGRFHSYVVDAGAKTSHLDAFIATFCLLRLWIPCCILIKNSVHCIFVSVSVHMNGFSS